MKSTNNQQMFQELSDREAEVINGGDALSDYINSIVAATGAYQYVPLMNELVSQDLLAAYQQGGTTGQVYYLLNAANWLSGIF